jgi:predicted Zn-dependent peptidase
MQVTLIPYGIAPKAVVSLRVFAGDLNEGQNRALASLTGQMLREGAGGRAGAELAEAAAGMGGNLGIGVDRHETAISLSVLSEHADDAVQLIGAVARSPDFPASELERVRASMLRNLAVARSQPQPTADAALFAAYYGSSHPYGRLYPTDAQLKSYTLDDVRRFHAENFGAKRARLYIAGRFDRDAVRAAIQQAYADWQPGPERLRLPPQPQPGPKLLLVDRPGAPQSTIRIAFPAPAAGAPQDLGFRVTNALLGGSFTSRITKNIREAKGYTYSPFSGVTYNAGEAMWAFNADVTTDVTGAALKEVIGEVRRLQTEAIPEEEAAGMRTWMAGTFVLQNASAGGLVNSLATRDFHGLPANWLEAYVPGVLGVGAADRPQLQALPELKNVRAEVVKPF